LPNCHLHIKGLRCPCPDYWITTQTASTAPATLGEHLKRRRLELHRHQKEVAQRLGVHFESFKNWERGIAVPTVRYVPKIIEFLGYDPELVPETPSRRIAYARRRLGFTQEDLAKALKVDSVSIWHWEKAHFEPPDAKMRQLSEMLKARQILIRL
jgi:transcriptional regulator with XRE-family HTH domain